MEGDQRLEKVAPWEEEGGTIKRGPLSGSSPTSGSWGLLQGLRGQRSEGKPRKVHFPTLCGSPAMRP